MNRKSKLAAARWPDRLTLKETRQLAARLSAKFGTRLAAAEAAGVSTMTLNRWARGVDRAPKAARKLLGRGAAK